MSGADITTLSYGASAFAYALLGALLLTSWKGRLQGGLLVCAVLATTVWSVVVALHAHGVVTGARIVLVAELVRNLFWLLFLARLMFVDLASRVGIIQLAGVAVLVVIALQQILATADVPLNEFRFSTSLNMIFVTLAVYSVVVVQQFFFRASEHVRWRIKFLCIGLLLLAGYDVFLYSYTLAFDSLDNANWWSRGAIVALAVPLVMVAAARNENWSVDVFVSRAVVNQSVVIVVTCLYLTGAFALGQFLGEQQTGEWGVTARNFIFASTGLLLILVLTSGQLRARLRVFVSKNFYKHRYDYREEWLNLTRKLANAESSNDLPQVAIEAMAGLVESSGGRLVVSDEGQLTTVASLHASPLDPIPMSSDMVRFMRREQRVIDLNEYARDSAAYNGITLPSQLFGPERVWLAVPLFHSDELIGAIFLLEPRAPRQLNWEDYDVIKVAARQVASDVAQARSAEALSFARQFETYNRVSAFVMHDLKNITGQLSLLVQNGQRLKHNQEFVDDAFRTVDNAVLRIKRLLGQLKHSRELNLTSRVHLNGLLKRVISERAMFQPKPRLKMMASDLQIVGNADKLVSVIGNVVQNAQDASEPDSPVEVVAYLESTDVVVMVKDQGSGMSKEFIANDLFKPFLSTKGENGMGIGAYEAKEYIESLGGRIIVTSEPGVGTEFALRFPRAHTDTVERVA